MFLPMSSHSWDTTEVQASITGKLYAGMPWCSMAQRAGIGIGLMGEKGVELSTLILTRMMKAHLL